MTAGASLKKRSILENTESLQMVSWHNDGTTQMYGWKCSFEKQCALNKSIYQMHCVYAIYDCDCSSKNYPIYLVMAKYNYLCEILWKELFPAINYTVTYKEQMFFRNNYSTLDHTLFLWAAISLKI